MDDYDYWHRELAGAGQSRDTLEPVCGRWRIVGAKTKPDYPVAIWRETDGSIWAKIAHAEPIHQDSGAYRDFEAFGFLKAVAVTSEHYEMAMEAGIWPDGKPAKAKKIAKVLDWQKLGNELCNHPRVRAALSAAADELAATGKACAGMEITNERIKV